MAKKDPNIDDSVWRKIRGVIQDLDRSYVKVGVLASSRGGTRTEDGDVTVTGLAAIHEFGAPKANIPERSFIRRTFTVKEAMFTKLTAKLAGMLLDGKIDKRTAYEVLGQRGAAEVKKTITTGEPIPPPLKPETIARKGSDRPLVDTGRLVNAVTHEVVLR